MENNRLQNKDKKVKVTRKKIKDYNIKSIPLESKRRFGYVIESPFCDGVAYLDCNKDGLFYRCEQTGQEFTDTFIGDISIAVHWARKERKQAKKKR